MGEGERDRREIEDREREGRERDEYSWPLVCLYLFLKTFPPGRRCFCFCLSNPAYWSQVFLYFGSVLLHHATNHPGKHKGWYPRYRPRSLWQHQNPTRTIVVQKSFNVPKQLIHEICPEVIHKLYVRSHCASCI